MGLTEERYVIETTCPNCGHVAKAETTVEALSKARDWAYRRSSEDVLPSGAARAEPGLREALRVLRGMNDDLADAVLAGVKPDDIGQPDWDAANDMFAAALEAHGEPQAEP